MLVCVVMAAANRLVMPADFVFCPLNTLEPDTPLTALVGAGPAAEPHGERRQVGPERAALNYGIRSARVHRVAVGVDAADYPDVGRGRRVDADRLPGERSRGEAACLQHAVPDVQLGPRVAQTGERAVLQHRGPGARQEDQGTDRYRVPREAGVRDVYPVDVR